MKKFVSLILVVIFLVAFSVPAIATTPAQRVIAALDAVQAQFSNDARVVRGVSQIRTWLANEANAATITDDIADTIVSQITAALNTAGDATSLSALNRDQLLAIQSNIERAAAAASLTPDVTVSGDIWTINVTDQAGTTVFNTTNRPIIQQTGIDASVLIAIIIGITLIFGAAIVVAVYTKKRQHAAV